MFVLMTGLFVFLAVQVLNLIGLFIDLWLWCKGYWTITGYVWETPIYGIPIIALQFIGLIGLITHLYGHAK